VLLTRASRPVGREFSLQPSAKTAEAQAVGRSTKAENVRAMSRRAVLVTAALAMGAVELAVGTAGASTPIDPVSADVRTAERAGVNAAPTTEVLSPSGPTVGRIVIRGRATDDRAVTKVKVTVKDRGTGRYWNPSTGRWQAEWLWYNASVQRPRSRTTEWSLAFNPGAATGSSRFQATAVAWDDQGRRDPGVARRRFRIDTVGGAPTTTITSPTAGALVDEGTLDITGRAADSDGVHLVRVTVRDLGANRYWNADLAAWQAEWGWFEADLTGHGATTATWSLPFDTTDAGASGRYRVTATSWDVTGRQDETRARIDFTALATDPGDGGAMTLVWNDEFNGTTLDPTRWKTFSGLYNTPYCFQNYTARPDNVRVEDGHLVLEAHAEPSGGQDYSSGMVVSNDFRDAANSSTKGNTSWRYGRFEMRARVPDAPGMWPAFWMRPTDSVYGSWPRSGEIDVLEYNGPRSTSWSDRRITHDLHWYGANAPAHNASFGRNTSVSATWLDQFHTFAVEWSPAGFRWFVDGHLTHEAGGGWSAPGGGAGAPFDQDFFITLNLQVGGWAGQVADAQLPAQYEVDYVRVYQ
jgi:beta-glucanase (GH16 family)